MPTIWAFATPSSACNVRTGSTRRSARAKARSSTSRPTPKAGRRATMNSRAARSTAVRTSLVAILLLAAGCMSMDDGQCRSADWYQVGYRDGDIYGLRPQIDQYAHLCKAHGV